MAIHLANGAELLTQRTQLISGARKFFVSVRYRRDPSENPNGWGVFLWGPFQLGFQGPSGGGQFVRMRNIVNAGGDEQLSRPLATMFGVQHFVLVYDADDPEKQGSYANGAFSKATVPFTGATSTSDQRFLLAALADGYAVEDLVIGVGVTPSVEQLAGLRTGDAATIAALQGEATGLAHWRFQETPGSPAGVPGDPGMVSDGTHALTFAITAPGDLAYVEPLEFTLQTRFAEPRVMSSGRFVAADLRLLTGEPLEIMGRDPALAPTFRINGGPPIDVDVIMGAGDNHLSLGMTLAGGVRVQPEDVVTWSAPEGLVTSVAGPSAAVVDAPCRNRVGKTSHDPPEGEKFRVGVNFTRPGAEYYSAYRINRNQRFGWGGVWDGGDPARYREDGSPKRGANGVLVEVPHRTSIDATGYPFPFGLWYLRWRDHGAAGAPGETACEFMLANWGYMKVTHRAEYRRDVLLPDGSYDRVRVYETGPHRETITLAAPIGPDDVEIPVVRAPEESLMSERMFAVVDLGGEVLTAPAADRSSTPHRLLNCVRGVRGTAQAWPAGAQATVGPSTASGRLALFLRAEGAGEIRCSDLVVLAPEDWDQPAEPGPAPLIDVDPLDVSKEFLRWIEGGLGISRFMDSTYADAETMNRPEEAEHLMEPDCFTWNYALGESVVEWTSVKQTVEGENKFAYFRQPAAGLQTYPVELLAPLDAAESGARQTIAVRATETEPLMNGSRLLAGSERMRVWSGSGDSWEVQRGVDGTTPEPHAAGTIQAGWRVPYKIPDAPNVLAFELTSAEPHGLWTNHPVTDRENGADVAAARRTLSLATPIDATTLTLAVNATLEDWDFLHPGLSARIGDERVELAAADPVAGTITLKARPAGAVAHAEGEPITTWTNRALCSDPDGNNRRWEPIFPHFYGFSTTGPNTAAGHVVSGVGPARVIGEQTFNPPARWVPRERHQFPVEFIVKCARMAGGWLWLNLPPRATDDMIVEICRRVLDGFPAGRKVIVETGNEIWNGVFPYWNDYANYRRFVGMSVVEAFVLESARMAEVVRAEFAKRGRGDEVLTALPWQQAQSAVVLQVAAAHGVKVDVVSSATYLWVRGTPENEDVVNRYGDDVACDVWVYELYSDLTLGHLRYNGAADLAALNAYEQATGWRPIQVHYEGGLGGTIPYRPGASNINPNIVQGLARNRDIRNHPNWYFAERDSHYLTRELFHGEGLAVFNCSQPPWAESLWGMSTYWGQRPGYGDGRSGGPDNTQNIHFQGVPESADIATSVDASKESVRWQAMIDHNKEFFAEDPPDTDPPDPDPGDGGGGKPRSRKALKLPMRSRLGCSRRL